MARSKRPAPKPPATPEAGKGRLYTLDVFLTGGPVTEKFAKKNPVVSRTVTATPPSPP